MVGAIVSGYFWLDRVNQLHFREVREEGGEIVEWLIAQKNMNGAYPEVLPTCYESRWDYSLKGDDYDLYAYWGVENRWYYSSLRGNWVTIDPNGISHDE